MKKNMPRGFDLISKIVAIIMVAQMIFTPIFVFADRQKDEALDKTEMVEEQKLRDDIHNMENYLNTRNTSILEELEKQEKMYKELLSNEQKSEERQKLEGLIIAVQELKKEYRIWEQKQRENINEISRIPMRNGTRGIIDVAAAKIVVAAIVAYFSANNYVLASELLMHAQKNKTLDSIYEPYFRSRVMGNPALNRIRILQMNQGSSEFNKGATEAEKDCFYAINKFSWTKKTNGAITISDRYDYAKSNNYVGIQDMAVNAMSSLQQSGHITPFQVRIVDI